MDPEGENYCKNRRKDARKCPALQNRKKSGSFYINSTIPKG